MGFEKWSTSNIEYGKKVLNSGLEGARSGREAFLHGRPLTPFLSEFVCQAWKPALLGTCVGVLSSLAGKNDKVARALGYGVLGGVVGFFLGVAWESRSLTESIASGAVRGIGKVRDERWLENHPIDYA